MTVTPLPELRTERLLLRALTLDDAPRVQELAGSWEVAATTLTLPHPYPDGAAEAWISGIAAMWEDRKGLALGITTAADGLIGGISLKLVNAHRHAEIGYWIGPPYWNRGFATEAAEAMLGYGFGALGMHRIVGRCFNRNPGSGKVLRKLGMTHEGTLREHYWRWERFEDVECYAILDHEWRARES